MFEAPDRCESMNIVSRMSGASALQEAHEIGVVPQQAEAREAHRRRSQRRRRARATDGRRESGRPIRARVGSGGAARAQRRAGGSKKESPTGTSVMPTAKATTTPKAAKMPKLLHRRHVAGDQRAETDRGGERAEEAREHQPRERPRVVRVALSTADPARPASPGRCARSPPSESTMMIGGRSPVIALTRSPPS